MDIRPTPWMADCEIEIMDSLFEAQRPKRVLEWGAGGSTLYWPPKYDFIETWLAVERDKAFVKALKTQAAKNVTVKRATGKRYWNQAGQYDMIIVDGHYRVECLDVARALLAEGGIVVLHDSGRSGYNKAWTLWPFAEELYVGELLKEDGYYKHRGVTVFWQDEAVEAGKWLRKYAVEADFPERPSYEPPGEMEAAIEERVVHIAEVVSEAGEDDLHTSTEGSVYESEYPVYLS